MPTLEEMEEENRRISGEPMNLESQFGSPLPPEAEPVPVAPSPIAAAPSTSSNLPVAPVPVGTPIERVPMQWSQSSTSGWDPRVRQKFGESMATGQEFGAEGIQKGVEASQMQARLEGERAKSMAELDAQAEREARDKLVSDRQAFQEYQARREKLAEEVNRAKVDPDRRWRDSSVGAKAGASIAMILGGIGAGLTHGPNTANEMLERIIDRDVEAQKDAIHQKRAGLSDMDNVYGMFLRQGNSERDALEKARLVSRQRILDSFDQSMVGVKNLRALENGAMARSQLEEQQQKGLHILGEAGPKSSTSTTGTFVSKGATASSNGLTSDEDQRDVPGVGLAKNSTEAGKLRETEGSALAMINLADKILNTRKQLVEAKTPLTDQKAILDSDSESLAEMIRADMKLKGFEEKQINHILKRVGNPTSWAQNTDAGLGAFKEQQVAKVRAHAGGQGVTPYPATYKPNYAYDTIQIPQEVEYKRPKK